MNKSTVCDMKYIKVQHERTVCDNKLYMKISSTAFSPLTWKMVKIFMCRANENPGNLNVTIL